ncbi:MAG: alkaline phosphatase family protein, partial [Acidobacteriota bacterium]
MLVKIDGLPGYYVDRFVKEKDPKTGKSVLPWIEKVFYENGTRVPNFYSRGISLSAPSWSVLDTGQHLQIKGNVEYDRYTQSTYDYLNFFNFSVGYGLSKVVDVQGVEVLDSLKIPLLSDAFPYDKRYSSAQLYGRGNDWAVIASGFVNLFPKKATELVDEWTIGVELRKLTINQNERDILGKIVKRPAIDYLDYFDDSFDHVSHHNNDTASRLASLKELDRTVGRIWNAIQDSSRADETAIVLVSDHGTNSDEKVYSQGYNLVKLLTSAAGGGHHVGTKRIVLQDYSFKIFYPPFYVYRNASPESYYLKGQDKDYLTALIDFDGNERTSIHLRNSDLNVLHMLFQRLQTGKLSTGLAAATRSAIFQILDEHRQEWQGNIGQLAEEMDALDRFIASEKKAVVGLQTKPNKDGSMRGLAEQNRRRVVALDRAIETEGEYRKYSSTITNLLAINASNLNVKDLKIESLIAPGAMGDPNSIYQLQNYVVGESANGLILDSSGRLDLEKSF